MLPAASTGQGGCKKASTGLLQQHTDRGNHLIHANVRAFQIEITYKNYFRRSEEGEERKRKGLSQLY